MADQVQFKRRKRPAQTPLFREVAPEAAVDKVSSRAAAPPPTTQSANTTANRDPPLDPRPNKETNDQSNEKETLYKGARAYRDHTGTEEKRAAGMAKKNKIGPVQAPSNVRVTCRFDYQMDICKDYKETGYCGFGDSCKFLHDRSTFKYSWQLDREWETLQRNRPPQAGAAAPPDEPANAAPDVCPVCRGEFSSPVVTKCGHYFCERCALSQARKSPVCAVCGAKTNGVFNTATQLSRQLAARAAAREERQAAIAAQLRASGAVASSDDESSDSSQGPSQSESGE